MPGILIAGCGYVGQVTADLFHARGWEVEGWTATVETAHKLSAKPYPIRAVNFTDRATIETGHGAFDVVLQCASSGGGTEEDYRCLYLEGARNLCAAFPTATLLFTSSTSVYAQKDGELVDEESEANPGHEKGRILRAAEDLILAHGGIVARLAGIYGPSRSFLLTRFLAGEAVIDPDDDRFINQIHRDDIASALVVLAEHRGVVRGRIYNAVDDEPARAQEIYGWLSEKLNRPMPPSGKKTSTRRRGDSNKRVANQRLREKGWRARFPTFRSAFAQSILPSFGIAEIKA